MFRSKFQSSSQPSDPSETTIRGKIRRVLFQTGGFMAAVLEDETKVAGSMHATPDMGRVYSFEGVWAEHPKFGWQFKFTSYDAEVPRGREAIGAYLRDTCTYLGTARVAKILEVYGDEALNVLKSDPERVAREIQGLNLNQATIIADQLREHAAMEALDIGMRTLFEGVRMRKTVRSLAIDKWGSQACEVIKANPFVLTQFPGCGFLSADQIARKVGFPRESPARIRAGILYVLDEATSSGHCYMSRGDLLQAAMKILGLAMDVVNAQVDPMHEDAELTIDNGDVYLPRIYVAERAVARDLRERAAGAASVRIADKEGLADDQSAAVDVILSARAALLTGPPGTGKTYTLKRVIGAFDGNEVAICAPTGKAARRIRELTGWNATTIHKLLEPVPLGGGWVFTRGPGNPIDQSVVVVDEVSMVPITLMASLIAAMRPETRLILTGDANQLPSVGPGAVLRDLMASKVISHAELSEIKRQAAGSEIIHACHAIRAGAVPQIENKADDDFFFMEERDATRLAATVVDLVYNRLPAKYGFDPLADIQVITGHREKTGLSAKALNSAMQTRRLAASGKERNDKQRLYVGDKVIQLSNGMFPEENTKGKVFVANGDIGIVQSVERGTVTVEFDAPTRRVAFSSVDNDLDLAYAVTVHKFQGSQARCIVIPLHRTTSARLLQRSWIYTAVSRAAELCVVVGEQGELAHAVARDEQDRRATRLKELLREEVPA